MNVLSTKLNKKTIETIYQSKSTSSDRKAGSKLASTYIECITVQLIMFSKIKISTSTLQTD